VPASSIWGTEAIEIGKLPASPGRRRSDCSPCSQRRPNADHHDEETTMTATIDTTQDRALKEASAARTPAVRSAMIGYFLSTAPS
jgi:hypothetical protein